jgi:hypothetical protein
MSKVGLSIKDWDSTSTTTTFSFFHVTKYVSTQPTVTVSDQEKSPVVVAHWKMDEGFTQDYQAPITSNETQIPILTNYYTTTNSTYSPTDNSLGLIKWNSSLYPDSTVYFEAEILDSGVGFAFAALYTSDGTEVTNSEVSQNTGTWSRVRSDALALTDNSEYTVRINHANGTTAIKSAKLVVIQSDPTKLTSVQTPIEIGTREIHGETSYTELNDKKIYNYDAANFLPTPTTYFEATLKGSAAPAIEQQVTLIDQPFVTSTSGWVPVDNSLGVFTWESSKYPGATVYFEAVALDVVGANPDTGLYTEAGVQLTKVAHSCGDTKYCRTRSAAINLVDGTKYTVRHNCNIAVRGCSLISARLIIQQTDPTKITDTQTTIGIGTADKGNSNAATELTDKKIYYYDNDLFTPTPSSYFETTIRSVKPTITQQINFIDQIYTATSLTAAPTDNSLGLIKWDGSKYNGETVYFEAVGYDIITGSGYTGLYTESGTLITTITHNCGDNLACLGRSGPLTLTDGTNYTVRHWEDNAAKSTQLVAARLVVVQTDATKLTDTQTQIDIGSYQTGITGTSYTTLTESKIYMYDQNKFSPTPEAGGDVEFHATLKINDSGDKMYAELYNKTNGTSVAELSQTGSTSWALKTVANVDADADWDTTNDDEYVVRVRCSDDNGGGCSGSISNAKIVLNQSDSNGITALEFMHQYTSNAVTDNDGTYTTQSRKNSFNNDIVTTTNELSGGVFSFFYEASMRTSAGTGYTQLYNDSVAQAGAISGSEISTSSTSNTRVRSSAVTMPTYPTFKEAPPINIQLKNGASNTTTVSSSWLVIQVNNLLTAGSPTVYADLYNATDNAQVANSEVSTSSTTWTDVRSSQITLTDNDEYIVRIKSSNANSVPFYLANARILQVQSAAGGISALEIPHQYTSSKFTDTDGTYTTQSAYNRFNPEYDTTQTSFAGGTFNYYFEGTLKASAGTGYASLYNSSLSSVVSNTEISTSATTYTRVRTNDITNDMPSVLSTGVAPIYDIQIKASTSNTASVSNSWLLIKVSGLSTAGSATAYAELYNSTDSTTVTGSEVSNSTANWARVRSGLINLDSEKNYIVRVKTNSTESGTIQIANAKLLINQTSVTGVQALQTPNYLLTYPVTDTDATYTDKDTTAYYDATAYGLTTKLNTPDVFFETTMKTSAGTGYIQLKNDTNTATISNSEITTTSTSYQRVRSNSTLYDYLPTAAKTLDAQVKNSASSGNTTTVANAWLLINNHNFQNVTHDSSGNNLHLLLKNNPTWKTGQECKYENCLFFDGVDDYLTTSNSPLLSQDNHDFTIMAWIKPNLGEDRYIYEDIGSTTNNVIRFYVSSANQLIGFVRDNSGNEITVQSNSLISSEIWQNVSLVRSGTTLKLFINGKEDATSSNASLTTIDVNSGVYPTIGASAETTSTNLYKGYMDEVKIYGIAKTADQISAEISKGATSIGISEKNSLLNTLYTNLRMEEASVDTCGNGTDSCDSSGNSHNATWFGNTSPTIAHIGKGLNFDGTGDYANISTPINSIINNWDEPTYSRRRILTINNSYTSTLTNYQVRIPVTYDSDMQADLDDIIFRDYAGNNLSYWRTNKIDSTSATFWVKIPTLNKGVNYIYMYYGNASVSSASNVADTFISSSVFSSLGDCPSTDTNCNSMDNHTEADYVRLNMTPLETSLATAIDEGNTKTNIFRRYRFLFLADTNGTHNFGMNVNDGGEISYFPEDSYGNGISTSHLQGVHTVLAYWYGAHNVGTCGTSGTPGSMDMTAGEGYWIDFIMANTLSTNYAQTCIQEPSSTFKTVSTTNFANQLYARQYISGKEPSIVINNEQTKTAKYPTFTFSGWVNPSILDASQRNIAAQGNHGSYDWFLGTSTDNVGKLIFSTDKGVNTGTSAKTLQTGTWYHIALVANEGKAKLYINGELDSETQSNMSLYSSTTITLGGDNAGAHNWNGKMDEVKIYEGSLANNSVMDLYKQKGIYKIYWNMDEGTGTKLNDSSGNYNIMTISNITSSNWVNGKIGKALRFDGTSNYGSLSYINNIDPTLIYKMKITFNNVAASEDLVNFPVLIKVNSTRIDYSKTQDTGLGIRFYDSDGVTTLPFEIEKWDETGDSFIWVKVPNIPAGSNNDYIWMQYANTAFPETQQPSQVWDSNYKSVMHLNDSSSSIHVLDSTSNNYYGNKVTATEPNYNSEGKIDGNQVFDASNDKVTTLRTWPTYVSNSTGTMSAWVKPTGNTTVVASSTGGQGIISDTAGYLGIYRASVGGNDRIWAHNVDGNNDSFGITYTPDEWVQVTWKHTGGNLYVYKNGDLVASGASGNTTNTTGSIELGKGFGAYLNGSLDETRVSSTARSDSWIKAEYLTTADTFNTYETPEIVYTTNGNSLTFSAWVYPTILDGTQRNIVARGYQGAYDWYIANSATNPGKILFSSDGGTNVGTSETTITTNNWFHISMRVDPSTTTLYINGKPDKSISNSGSITKAGALTLGAGSDGNNLWEGIIDEVKVSDYAKNTEEIMMDANGGHAAPGSPYGSAINWYKFDEGVGLTANNSGNTGTTYNGIISGATWTRSGKFDRALSFDAIDDKVDISNSAIINSAPSGTISLWAFSNNTDSTVDYIYSEDTATNSVLNIQKTAENKFQFGIKQANGTWKNATVTEALNPNVWYHIAVTFDTSSKEIRIYINGVLKNTQSTWDGTFSSGVDNVLIGDAVDSGTFGWGGYIDEVKIYNFKLSESQIVMEYNGGKSLQAGILSTDESGNRDKSSSREICVPGDTSTCNAPVAEWKFEEASGNKVYDTSGNGLDGDIVNSVERTTGKYGKGVHFDGGTGYINVPHNNLLNPGTGSYSWELWTKIDKWPVDWNDYVTIYQKSTGNMANGYLLSTYPTPEFFSIISNTTGTDFQSDSYDAKPTGNWYHIVQVWNTDTNKQMLYINGVLEDVDSVGSMDTMNGSTDLIIGAGNGGVANYRGTIDEIRFYDYARSATQVAWSYNKGDPLLNYRLDECTGTTINNNGATQVNANLTVGAGGTQTATGICLTGSASDAWYNGRTGKENSSINLDGNDDYISTTNSVLIAPDTSTYDNVSWSVSIYPTATPTSTTILEKGNEFRIITDSNGIPICSYYNGGWINSSSQATALTENSWTHIMCTYDGNNLKVYINAEDKGATSSVSDITSTAATALNIGRSAAGSGYFTGKIDNAKIYGYTLNSLLIKAAYASGSVQFGN